MRTTGNLTRSFLLAVVALLSVGIVFGQDDNPPPDDKTNELKAVQRAPELLRQLGLSREQIQQIRRLNQQRKPLVDAAQKKVADANRLLDEAIYADEVNDTEIAARMKECQLAQAEVIKVRSLNELAIRKILTQEQLVKFRELRRRFEEVRDRMLERRQNGDRPVPISPRERQRNLIRGQTKPPVI